MTPAITVVHYDVGPPGGTETAAGELVRGLLAMGWNVTVVSRSLRVAPHARLRWIRIPLPARPFPVLFVGFWILGGLAVRIFRRGLVNTHNAVVPNRADVCTVQHCHASVAALGVKSMVRDDWLHRLNRRIADPMKLWAERYCYRRAITREYVASSIGLQRELEAFFPDARGHIHRIKLGATPSSRRAADREAVRARLEIPPGALVALFLGGDWRRKNLPAAIRAISLTRSVHLIVVGRGDAAEMRLVASDLGCESRVHFVGPAADTGPYFAAADVFVLLSGYETYSIAAHEAAASGLPVLSTRVHGVDELIVDGQNGWIVTTADECAARLSDLDSDRPALASMSARASDSARSLTWSAMVDGYVSLIANDDRSA